MAAGRCSIASATGCSMCQSIITHYWVLNTDEAGVEGRRADLKMFQHSCVAALKDPKEDSGWALRKLSKSEAGDRVFFYKKGIGVNSTALFDHTSPFPSNTIFGLRQAGEYSRKVTDLNTRPRRTLSCAAIQAQTGNSFRPLSTMFMIKIKSIATFLEESF